MSKHIPEDSLEKGQKTGVVIQNIIPQKYPKLSTVTKLPEWLVYLFPRFKISPELIKHHMTKGEVE